MDWFKGRKPVGTIVQYKDGNTHVKTRKGWVRESRLVAEMKLLNRDLDRGEKVYHRDCTQIGKDGYNDKDNLVVLKFNLTKYRLLPHPNIVFLPKDEARDSRAQKAQK